MKYFFVLGNNPTLSLAELAAVFNLNKNNVGRLVSDNIFILEPNKKINPAETIKTLGGTIKIGQIIAEANQPADSLIKKIKTFLEPGAGKFKFGISYYGQAKFNIKPLGMEIKKYLKEQGLSCRWVISREKTLSSVVVTQNKLTSKGVEIVLIQDNHNILIGRTLAVQPFKELSFRDYGRPARDHRSGLLPPKLAQIMINLSQSPFLTKQGLEKRIENHSILDPCCGSGTILTEAMLMGYKNLIGSDISAKAVNDTKENIDWIKKQYKIHGARCAIQKADVAKLSKFIKPESISAIITEPYLGPARGKHNIEKISKELERLYSKSLSEFNKILKPNGRVVMIFPVFQKGRLLTPDLNSFKIINPIPKNLWKNKAIKLTNRNTIVYGRIGQKVWREIVVLEK